jgi:hypothetical protein
MMLDYLIAIFRHAPNLLLTVFVAVRTIDGLFGFFRFITFLHDMLISFTAVSALVGFRAIRFRL